MRVSGDERFDPRVGMTRQAVQTWWDILGSAMLARGEISPKLTMNDVFDLEWIAKRINDANSHPSDHATSGD